MADEKYDTPEKIIARLGVLAAQIPKLEAERNRLSIKLAEVRAEIKYGNKKKK